MQKAALVFVKGDGHDHRVWITPEGRDAHSVVLNVAHDLPHLVVESLLGVDDGLWAVLVETGVYPGLTREHLVAKTLTNSILNRFGDGPNTVEGVFARLSRYRQREEDRPMLEEINATVQPYLAKVDAELIDNVQMMHAQLASQWWSTPLGDTLRLDWPLP